MKSFVFYLAGFLCFSSYSQVGVGTPDPRAQLDVIANSPDNPSEIDGFLLPRINKFPVTSPNADQHSMIIFLNNKTTDRASGFYFWDNNEQKWETISGSGNGNFFKTGTTANPNNITDDMYRSGNIGIGTEEITAKLQITINAGDNEPVREGLAIDNNNSEDNSLTTYGIINSNRSLTNGTKYGIKTKVAGDGSGIHYGIHNITNQNTGTNEIYGIYNRVGRTYGGFSDHFGIYSAIGSATGQGYVYGIYSSAFGNTPSKVFAGYFAGRLGIGFTPEEEYILPGQRGTKDQVLKENGSGTVEWKHNNTRDYSSTESATGNFDISEEVSTLRINNNISSLQIPPANINKGRIIILIGWDGISDKTFNFSGNDDVYDVVNSSKITSISRNQILKIQSAGNRWILLGN